MKNIFRKNVDTVWQNPLLTGALLLQFLALLLLAGCSGSSGSRVADVEDEPLANMGAADVHRVQSDKLKMIMRTMNMTIYDREATALDIDADRLRRAKMIAVLLGMISDELVSFVQKEPQLKLTPEEQGLFVKYSDELGEHSKAFEEIAATARSEAFMPTMKRTVQTCNACHDRFRDM